MGEETRYIELLIARGEGQHLDFKYNISDSRKIARSLVAFANTEGGKLLVGVKDNGAVAGIMSEEELFMLEAASNLYSRPAIPLENREWALNKKTILEVTIAASPDKPHFAENAEGKWLAYVRHHDKNILANTILLKLWERQKSPSGTYIRYKKEEEFLLAFLVEKPFITLGHFCQAMRIPRHRAERVIVNLLALGIIRINYGENFYSYSLV